MCPGTRQRGTFLERKAVIHSRMLSSLPVFMYHSVSRQSGRLALSPELLDEQCRYLKIQGWRGISLEEAENCLLRGKKIPRKACLLSFDDGYLDNYVYAEPVLRAYGHHGVIFPVVDLLEDRQGLLPNQDDLTEHPELATQLGDLHTPVIAFRSRHRVRNIRFCNWQELRRMRENGVMDAAPHSLGHARVISGLEFTDFFKNQGRRGFFAVSPYAPPWGMPMFPTEHALATRGYIVNPALFKLVREIVPQTNKEAGAFLNEPAQRDMLLKAIKGLPSLGRRETEEEFRTRLAAEFTACRERFAANLGVTPVSFCWPWGDYCQESIEEAEEAGFRLLFCTSKTFGRYRQARPVRRVAVRFHTTPQVMLRKARLLSCKPIGVIYRKIAQLVSNGAFRAKKKPLSPPPKAS